MKKILSLNFVGTKVLQKKIFPKSVHFDLIVMNILNTYSNP